MSDIRTLAEWRQGLIDGAAALAKLAETLPTEFYEDTEAFGKLIVSVRTAAMELDRVAFTAFHLHHNHMSAQRMSKAKTKGEEPILTLDMLGL